MRRNRILFYVLIVFLLIITLKPDFEVSSAPLEIVSEGKDFATQVLHDPWDMEQYSDISQFLNSGDSADWLQNFSVSNGLFRAQSTSLADAQFFTLFPGYWANNRSAISIGNLGAKYPINSSTYHCLYIAMQTDTASQGQAFWFYDGRLNSAGNDYWGASAGFAVKNSWKLYQINLASIGAIAGSSWDHQATWQGLRIDPTLLSNVYFNIDWVRLTDCNTVYKSISYSGSGPVNVYIQPSGTTREIEVALAVSSNPYSMDVQGMQPGTYNYIVKKGTSIVGSGVFSINQAPIVNFVSPSMMSGEEYALTAGNAWDMSDTMDASDARDCVSETWTDGLLSYDTLDLSAQLTRCTTGAGSSKNNDPIFYLNTPEQFDPNEYRYLSFRTNIDSPIQNFGGGMIFRWGWNFGPTINACEAVTNDIPFDVGWNTYSFDLLSGENGSIIQKFGTCPSVSYWKDSGPIHRVRFDPNENQTGGTIHQDIDWIKLTKMDRVQAGIPYAITITANKTSTSFNQLTYYYTSSLLIPQQHIANAYIYPFPAGPYYQFLPITSADSVPNTIIFQWDTTGVNPNNYYVCVVANDGNNQGTFCSDAPVKIE